MERTESPFLTRTESPVPTQNDSAEQKTPEQSTSQPKSTTTARLATVLKCPYPRCPVETNSLQRHLRLVHNVRDARKIVKHKGKCLLCDREVSEYTAHVRGYHKIKCKENLYRHIIQLARHGFSQTASESPEPSSSENEDQSQDMMDSFQGYLEGLDGGAKTENTALQHVRQVRQVIQEKGLAMFEDVGPLMEKGGFLHRHWKEPEITGKPAWRVGTLKSYLYSLKLFLEFCKFSEDFVTSDRCDTAIQRISRWLTSLKVDTKVRRQDLYKEQAQQLLSAEDLRMFFSSPGHTRVLKLLSEAATSGDAHVITQYVSASTIATDLILWLLLTNGNRSGAVLNATVTEFRNATQGEPGKWVLQVRNHKTYASHGPCYLVLPLDLYESLATWVDIVRPMLTDQLPAEERVPNIFVYDNGHMLPRSTSLRKLKAYTSETLGVSNVTATTIRKSLVNLVRTHFCTAGV